MFRLETGCVALASDKLENHRFHPTPRSFFSPMLLLLFSGRNFRLSRSHRFDLHVSCSSLLLSGLSGPAALSTAVSKREEATEGGHRTASAHRALSRPGQQAFPGELPLSAEKLEHEV